MILSYLESIKYVGHLWPVTFLRFFIGFQYLRMAFAFLKTHYLEHPYISEQLRLKMETMGVLNSYFSFWSFFIQENWLVVSYVIVCTYFVVGVSYILGYLVRPIALWAAFVSLHLFWLVEAQTDMTQLFVFSIHLTFCLLGAGRCLGLDYYFYKTRRGILW